MDQSRIKKLGQVLHRSDLGNAIVKNPPKLPRIGSDVVTENLEHIGTVIDIFGPVKEPYVSIKVKTDCDEKITQGILLYVIEKKRQDVRRKKQTYPSKSKHNSMN